jgi:hypothetical protein
MFSRSTFGVALIALTSGTNGAWQNLLQVPFTTHWVGRTKLASKCNLTTKHC